MAFDVEHTDTFGGEANYCWVNRYRIDGIPERTGYSPDETHKRERRYLVRKAKALCGLTGVRCDVEYYGDMIRINPRGICQVVFISWADDVSPEVAP